VALISIISKTRLASPLILAPERYDPRRKLEVSGEETIELSNIAVSVRKMIKPSDDLDKYLVIDTSDAREGIIIARKQTITSKKIGSTKKNIATGDVIVSRLRPYLRQVAFIDEDIFSAKNAQLLCSTEFFVLRSIDNQSIAFLVPFLLSKKVQEVLAASQEGGHHPRFIESTLLTLPVPNNLILQRNTISKIVTEAIKSYRFSESVIAETIKKSDRAFEQYED
jgi:hypothetical protein